MANIAKKPKKTEMRPLGVKAKFVGHRIVEQGSDLREDESIQNLIDDNASEAGVMRPYDILSIASAGTG
jgi:hypothetical protein